MSEPLNNQCVYCVAVPVCGVSIYTQDYQCKAVQKLIAATIENKSHGETSDRQETLMPNKKFWDWQKQNSLCAQCKEEPKDCMRCEIVWQAAENGGIHLGGSCPLPPFAEVKSAVEKDQHYLLGRTESEILRLAYIYIEQQILTQKMERQIV
jgi:hypothetical protein